ncbi:MAG: hypothetical protein IKH81_03380 [Clostridia bacterium]|nr:hypothetical protein [Clostridia bacterium]
MSFPEKPVVHELPDGGKYWTHYDQDFAVLVYVPVGDPRADVINYGFKAPYLLVFGRPERSIADAVEFAERRGLADLARETSSSVVFVVPRCEGGWKNAPETIFQEVVAESRIGQYYEDGTVIQYKFRTKELTGYSIRGSVFRTMLYGIGDAADYIAENCLKTLQGEYLWGPGEITPMAVTLENLSVIPHPERRDIPVVSVGNSEEINEALRVSCDRLLIREKADYRADYADFWCRYKRWCGVLSREEDLDALGMAEEACITEVTTSPDNRGDDAGTVRHPVGYLAYYPKNAEGPLPLVLAFHGGGDSAFHIAWVSGWWRVAMRNRFLLVCTENHLNTTATEVMELIGQLKEKYPVDSARIYATGFSMGGCKTWDLYQEYPDAFAALAPMDATFEVGRNQYGETAPRVNRGTPVPLFYAAGEQTPLPEMPCQAEKCMERAQYVFEVNRVRKPYGLAFEERESWPEKFWGVPGDRVEKVPDPSRGAVLTLHYYDSTDGACRTVFGGVDNQGHECREHTCEQAWRFMKAFSIR